MSVENLGLVRLLHGGRTRKVPFWEPWFAMHDFCRRYYGDYSHIESRIAMAKDLGMDAVRLDVAARIDTNVHFVTRTSTTDKYVWYGGGSLRSLSQIEERGDVPNWDREIAQLQGERRLVAEAGLACWMVLPWCFHAIATSMGLERFALTLYDDFDFIDAAFEWVESRNRKAIDVAIKEIKPDFVLFDGDCAYKTGLMINPDMFRRLTFERTRETVSHLRGLGIPYTFHSDGKLDDVIPMLIELGFSAVHGCEKAANDLDDLVHRFGGDICLAGNMDVVFLSRATVEEVRRETERMLEIGSQKGRFIAACNTSPMDYIPDENYKAMADVIKHF